MLMLNCLQNFPSPSFLTIDSALIVPVHLMYLFCEVEDLNLLFFPVTRSPSDGVQVGNQLRCVITPFCVLI